MIVKGLHKLKQFVATWTNNKFMKQLFSLLPSNDKSYGEALFLYRSKRTSWSWSILKWFLTELKVFGHKEGHKVHALSMRHMSE